MDDAKTIYAASAFESFPRLLSLLDRNPFSPTYGCFHRDYWLYKTSDFPDAVRQFAVHALALAYTHDFRPYTRHPTPYTLYQNPNVRDWAIAGLTYWAKIQHADGSFDEFYPFERGWVGPTAFTTYAAAASYQLLKAELQHTSEVCTRVKTAIRRAAHFIAAGDSEEDHLANHHAMAVLAVTTTADILDDPELWAAVPRLWQGFLRYQDPEGWSREYDGADPGYLSATISFLAKTEKIIRNRETRETTVGVVGEVAGPAKPDAPNGFPPTRPALAGLAGTRLSDRAATVSRPTDGTSEGTFLRASASVGLAKKVRGAGELRTSDIRSVLTKAVEFCSYFVYPDGSYAGTIGSRNTLHFYPHGFELLGGEMPIAASVADRLARGLADGKLVPPEIMSDRYVHYRVPEFLLAAIAAGPRPAVLSQLPYERPPFVHAFPKAGIAVSRHGPAYTVANLAKGGAIKSFNAATGQLALNDTGWVGELGSGQLVTSQWIDPAFNRRIDDHTWTVHGKLQAVPPVKLFSLWKNILFRLMLGLLGWYPPAAHRLKGAIRKSLILGHAALPCTFTRRVELSESQIMVIDELSNKGRLTFRRLLLGGEYPMRYVPQSRFFQSLELETTPRIVTDEEIRTVNSGGPLRIERRISL